MPANDRPWDKKDRRDDDDDDRPRRRRDEDDETDDDRPRRRRPRDEEDEYDDRPRKAAQKSNGLATASLILGALALCTGPLTGLPALICGAIALTRPGGRGMAIAGLVLGGLFTIGIPLLLLPAVFKVREAAARMQDQNNMKQVVLAFHNDHDRTGGMSQYARDDNGKVKTGLSWRVGMLPYIEQASLHRQFDLDQPWDGPKNRTASNTPIKTYTSPYENGNVASAQTPYRVFYGGGAVFNEDGNKVSLASITDGTSNTILMVHATEQVPWAEPRELRYDPNGPLPKFGQPNMKGFNVALADGSVRFVTTAVPERTLRILITKNDGQMVPLDW